MINKTSLIIMALSIAGCANENMSREELLGTAAGAAAGGFIGYSIGGFGLGVGSDSVVNSLFATVGTAAGGYAGYHTTRALMGSDLAEYKRTAVKGLAQANDGQVLDWKNNETGNSGIFRTVGSFRMNDGRLCRQYRTTVSYDKNVRSGVGIACRQPNGHWQVISDDFS